MGRMLEHVSELRNQMAGALKELNLQFQRIAQMQAQLDHLLSALAVGDAHAVPESHDRSVSR
jgi:hypothetical protein